MNAQMISICRPTATFGDRESAPTFDVGRPLAGLRVGIRNDPFWRSWLQISDIWSDMLRRDGAEPVILRIGEHVGEGGEITKAQVQAWADSVDCAVVGLAN